MCPLVHLCGRNGQNMFQALYSFWVSESNCFSLVVVFFVLFCFFKAGSICLCLPDLILVLFSVFVSSLLKAVLIFRLGDFLIFRKMLLNFFFFTSAKFKCVWIHSFLWFALFVRRTFSGKVCSVFKLRTETGRASGVFYRFFFYPFGDLLYCSS